MLVWKKNKQEWQPPKLCSYNFDVQYVSVQNADTSSGAAYFPCKAIYLVHIEFASETKRVIEDNRKYHKTQWNAKVINFSAFQSVEIGYFYSIQISARAAQ